MANQSQLDIETQINAALRQRAALMEQQKSALVDQVAIAQELCRALDCQELDGFNERLATTRDLLNEGAAGADSVTKSTNNMSLAAKKSSKSFFSFKGAAVGAAVAMKNAFGKVGGILKSLGKLAIGLVKGAFSLVRGAFQAWNGMMDGLFQKSQENANAGIGLRNAYEKVKETLGSLSSGAGKAAIDSFDKLRSSGGNLAGTGISISKMFGRGPDGLAAALEFVNEQISGLGPQMDRFAGQMADAAEEVLVMGKSLGFAGEDFARMATMAGYAGESLKETMQRLMKQIVGTSKQFKVNSRVMAANFKTMMKMPAIFGSNTKEMLKTSVAAQKLGMSIEELTAATSVFDDFESGAMAAADLAAEFGIVVDSMDMMTATPAEQVMQLKSALDASGQSFENMSRQERARLADLTGMDATALQKMMDPSNAFDQKEMDKVDKGIDNAAHAQMSMVEATKELAKAIAQVNEAAEPLNTSGGFFGAWTEGVTRGFTRSKEFRAILDSVNGAFKTVFHEGQKVGAVLAKLIGKDGPFFFISQYFFNLEETMANLMPKITEHFETFVADLSSDGDRAAMALSNLIENLIDAFFGPGGEGESQIWEGFKKAFDLVLANIINIAPLLAEGLIALFEGAIALMTGDYSMFGDMMGEDFTMPMTMKAIERIKDDKTIDKLGTTFMLMLETFWEKFGEPITNFLGMIIGGAFIAALVQALPMIAAAGALKGLASGIMSKFGAAMGPAGAAGEAMPEAKSFGDKMTDFFLGIEASVTVLARIWNSGELMDAVLTLGVMALSFGAALLGVIELAVHMQNRGVSAITMAVMTGAIYGLAKSSEAVGNLLQVLEKVDINKQVAIKAAAVIGAMLIVFGAIAGLMVWVVSSLATIDVKPGFESVVSAAADLTMAIAKATALIVGMAAFIVLIAALGTNPIGAAIIAAAIGGAMVVFIAIAALVKSIVADFATFTESEAARAEKSANAAGKLTEVLSVILAELKDLVLIGADPEMFEAGVKTIQDMMCTISTHLLPTAVDVSKMMKAADPDKVERNIKILVSLMDAFAPLANMMTALLSIQAMEPDRMTKMIRKVNDGLVKVFKSMRVMVRDVVTLSSQFGSKEEMESMAAVAPILSSVANVFKAIAPSGEMLTDSMRDVYKYVQTSSSYHEDFGSLVSGGSVTTSSSGGYQKVREESMNDGDIKIRRYVEGMAMVIDSVQQPLERLVKGIALIDVPGSPGAVAKKMGIVSSVMSAVSDSMNVIGQMKTLTEGKFGGAVVGLIRYEFGNVASLFDPTAAGDVARGPVITESIKTIVTNIDQMFKDLGGTDYKSVEKFGGLMTNIGSLFGSFSDVSETEAKSFGHKMAAIVDGFSGLEDKFSSNAVKPMVDMIKAFNEIGEELNSSENIIEVDSLLANVTEALTLADAHDYTIKKSNVQVTVKLNVVMDVDSVAKTMIKAERVTPGAAYDENLNLQGKYK